MAVAVTLDSKVWSPVINHQDIVPGNLIEKDNQIFLIDWEYSAFGHPDIDLVRLYGLDYESEFTKIYYFYSKESTNCGAFYVVNLELLFYVSDLLEIALLKTKPSSNNNHIGIAKRICEITSGGVNSIPRLKHNTNI